MRDFISRPRRVKAVQFKGTLDSFTQIETLLRKNAPDASLSRALPGTGGVVEPRLESPHMSVDILETDWVIVNTNGVAFMANDEAFRESYRPADDEDPSEVLDPEGGTHERPLN